MSWISHQRLIRVQLQRAGLLSFFNDATIDLAVWLKLMVSSLVYKIKALHTSPQTNFCFCVKELYFLIRQLEKGKAEKGKKNPRKGDFIFSIFLFIDVLWKYERRGISRTPWSKTAACFPKFHHWNFGGYFDMSHIIFFSYKFLLYK